MLIKSIFSLWEGTCMYMFRLCVKNQILFEEVSIRANYRMLEKLFSAYLLGDLWLNTVHLISFMMFHCYGHLLRVWMWTYGLHRHPIFSLKQFILLWTILLLGFNNMKVDISQSLTKSKESGSNMTLYRVNRHWAIIQSSRGCIVQSIEHSRMRLSKKYCNHIFFTWLVA